jgi:hypothetical protein
MTKEMAAKKPWNYELFLIKFGRLNAWLLIVFVILYFISGFGMIKSGMIYNITGGIFTRGVSLRIHEYLTLPMAFSFLCHTLIAIRFAMIRWKVKNKILLNYVFLGMGVIAFALIAYAYFA